MKLVLKNKEKIVEIVRDVNLNRFYDDKFKIPYHVDEEYIKILFENKPKIRIKKIPDEPTVGLVMVYMLQQLNWWINCNSGY